MGTHDAPTLGEQIAARGALEADIASALGRLVFAYSRFVSALHYCVAWHNDGQHLQRYPAIAEDLGAANLLKRIEAQARARFGEGSPEYTQYASWVRKAHKLRELRNVVMHSRWNIETHGRYAIAISTPPFVEPETSHTFTLQILLDASVRAKDLVIELNVLRERHAL
jgi:hypothetical protein